MSADRTEYTATKPQLPGDRKVDSIFVLRNVPGKDKFNDLRRKFRLDGGNNNTGKVGAGLPPFPSHGGHSAENPIPSKVEDPSLLQKPDNMIIQQLPNLLS